MVCGLYVGLAWCTPTIPALLHPSLAGLDGCSISAILCMAFVAYMMVPIITGPLLEAFADVFSTSPTSRHVNEAFKRLKTVRPRLLGFEDKLGPFGIWYRFAIWPLWFVNLWLEVAVRVVLERWDV